MTRPTAQQVAERSGVSLRSIFRIFDDVETLHTAASMRQIERNRHLYVEVPATGSLAERVDAVVDLHDTLYTSVAPVRRAALRAAPDSNALRAQLDRARGWLQAEIQRVFADELAASNDARPYWPPPSRWRSASRPGTSCSPASTWTRSEAARSWPTRSTPSSLRRVRSAGRGRCQ